MIHYCVCDFNITFQWELNEINPLNGNITNTINLESNPTYNLDYFNITNGSIKYGLYKFTIRLNLIPLNNPTLVLKSSAYSYVKIISSGYILSAFNQDIAIDNKLSIGLLDTIAFVPAFYSKDLDNLVIFNQLSYNYYCILEDLNTNLQKSFDDDLHSIKPDTAITNDQMNSDETCFKSKSNK